MMDIFQLLIIIGRIVLFLLPGTLLSKLLFHKEKPLWVLSIGILSSFMLTGFGALALSELGYLLTRPTLLIYNSILSLVIFLIYLQRNYRSLSELPKRVRNNFKKNMSNTYFIAVGLFIGLVVLIFPIAQNHNNQGYTEFLILDAFSDSAPWNRAYDLDEPIVINFIIISHEKTSKPFQVVLRTNDEEMITKDLGILKPEGVIKEEFLIPPRIFDQQQFQLFLFVDNSAIPYRTLSFWINSE